MKELHTFSNTRAYLTLLSFCWGPDKTLGSITGEWGVHTSDVQFMGARAWLFRNNPRALRI